MKVRDSKATTRKPSWLHYSWKNGCGEILAQLCYVTSQRLHLMISKTFMGKSVEEWNTRASLGNILAWNIACYYFSLICPFLLFLGFFWITFALYVCQAKGNIKLMWREISWQNCHTLRTSTLCKTTCQGWFQKRNCNRTMCECARAIASRGISTNMAIRVFWSDYMWKSTGFRNFLERCCYASCCA